MIIKKIISNALVRVGVDSLFRKINKKKLLAISYHGICENNQCPGLFSHLPISIFEYQMKWLKKNYHILSMEELLCYIKRKKPFPDSSAIITFDDGFMSNYDLAFPILTELNIPATIALTVNYIGTNKSLWFDDLFRLLKFAKANGVNGECIKKIFRKNIPGQFMNNIIELYQILSSEMKKHEHSYIVDRLNEFKEYLGQNCCEQDRYARLLNWEQVRVMSDSGLIEFALHTANHRILTKIPDHELDDEILKPKLQIESIINKKIKCFCYPNGTPEIDFDFRHERYLEKIGFECAFCTGEYLNAFNRNPFRLGRKPAGNDFTSNKDFFKLNLSGITESLYRPIQNALNICNYQC